MSRNRKRRRDSSRPFQKKVITIRIKGISNNQIRYIQSMKFNDFTLALGHAGTGKTYCAVGMGLKLLFNPQSDIKKIIVVRRAIAACEDSIGHLPGDALEKMMPYFGSILDNLEEFIDRQVLRNLIREEQIEIVPLAFLRGRTLKNCFIIVEEAQNNSIEAMKMILTRVGNGSKIVVTGDINQRDRRDEVCGLIDAAERFHDCPGFGIIHLYDKNDIVRNEQTSRIIERYEET